MGARDAPRDPPQKLATAPAAVHLTCKNANNTGLVMTFARPRPSVSSLSLRQSAHTSRPRAGAQCRLIRLGAF